MSVRLSVWAKRRGVVRLRRGLQSAAPTARLRSSTGGCLRIAKTAPRSLRTIRSTPAHPPPRALRAHSQLHLDLSGCPALARQSDHICVLLRTPQRPAPSPARIDLTFPATPTLIILRSAATERPKPASMRNPGVDVSAGPGPVRALLVKSAPLTSPLDPSLCSRSPAGQASPRAAARFNALD